MTVTIGKKEAQPIVGESVEAKVLAPRVESLGRVGELSKGKEHPVPDSVSSFHS